MYDSTEVYSLNLNFTHKLVRISLANMALKETVKEDAETKAKVFQDRQHQVEAVIVRLMKSRKCISHDDLFNQTILDLKFPLDNTLFKTRINNLIERDYLVRDTSDMNLYKYVA
eukprot:NODE_157_length_15108_cov_0.423079.p14 type:complete len:114 gc:universal NODE_157_length_15108_cov_0.423079:7590-7249(-)